MRAANDQDTNGSLIEALVLEAGAAEPPAALRDLILASARSERQERRRVSRRPAWSLAAVAALASLGVAIWALSLGRSLDRTRTVQAATVDAVVLLARPDTRRLPLQGAQGLLAVNSVGRAVLIVNSLARAPVGKTYEAWLISSEPAAPAGVFKGGGKLSVVPLTRPVPPGALVAVTLERQGGSRQPHRPLVFAATQSF